MSKNRGKKKSKNIGRRPKKPLAFARGARALHGEKWRGASPKLWARGTKEGKASVRSAKEAPSKGRGASLRGRKIRTFTVAQLAQKGNVVKGNKFFSAAQARKIREILLRLRERMTGQINFLAADNLSRSDKDNEVSYRSEEQGTDNFDRDFALNRVSLDQEILFEIDEALNRLALGTCGICDSCGRGIEKARLKAVPYSRMCVACKSRSEGGQKAFKSFDSATIFHNAEKAAGEAGAEEE